MSRKTKPTTPRSLFLRTKTATTGNLVDLLRAEAKRDHLAKNIADMLAIAGITESNPRIENAGPRAKSLRQHLSAIRRHVSRGDARWAAIEAMRATQVWMELRMDALLAEPVREKETRLSAAKNRQAVTDEQVQVAYRKHKTYADAAEELGVTERTVGSRIRKIKRRKP